MSNRLDFAAKLVHGLAGVVVELYAAMAPARMRDKERDDNSLRESGRGLGQRGAFKGVEQLNGRAAVPMDVGSVGVGDDGSLDVVMHLAGVVFDVDPADGIAIKL